MNHMLKDAALGTQSVDCSISEPFPLLVSNATRAKPGSHHVWSAADGHSNSLGIGFLAGSRALRRPAKPKLELLRLPLDPYP